MSQLVKMLRSAGRATGRPTAGFGSRNQDSGKKRLILIAALAKPDVAAAKAAFAAGADLVEVAAGIEVAKLKELTSSVDGPLGIAFGGGVASGDFSALEDSGVDYVKVEAGDVPASVFLLETPAVVIELRQEFSDTMLKMLNFLPAKAVQVDSPDDIAGFTIIELMEKRVDRELISKPLLMKVGANAKPADAQLLALVAPNGLVVPAADVAAWKDALSNLKDPADNEDETGGAISLKAPAA
jgi:hypothetical protein